MTGSGRSKSIDPRRLALVVEDLREIAHEFGVGDEWSVTLALLFVALDHGVDGGIGHAFGGSDDAFAEFIADDLAAVVEFHDEDLTRRSTWGRRLQMSVESSRRQHGDGAVGEVDAGVAQTGFLIERAAGSDILGDVGNVDLQFEIVVRQHANKGYGVVEIAGGFSVDGDDRQGAEVTAM